MIPCILKLSIHSIVGKPLDRGTVIHCAATFQFQLGCTHQENISFLVLEFLTINIFRQQRASQLPPHTVPAISCHVYSCPEDRSLPCHYQTRWPWRTTWKRLWNKDTSTLPHLVLFQNSYSCLRWMEPCMYYWALNNTTFKYLYFLISLLPLFFFLSLSFVLEGTTKFGL